MKLAEVRDLLALIEGYERAPIPATALEVWFAELTTVNFEDAAQAVKRHYRVGPTDRDGRIRKIMPVEVKRVAEDFRTARLRALGRKAVEGVPVRRGSTDRPAEVEAMLAKARATAAAASAKFHASELVSA